MKIDLVYHGNRDTTYYWDLWEKLDSLYHLARCHEILCNEWGWV